jgi:hypothetical protein
MNRERYGSDYGRQNHYGGHDDEQRYSNHLPIPPDFQHEK